MATKPATPEQIEAAAADLRRIRDELRRCPTSVEFKRLRTPGIVCLGKIIKAAGSWVAFRNGAGVSGVTRGGYRAHGTDGFVSRRSEMCGCGAAPTHWPKVTMMRGNGALFEDRLSLCSDCYDLHLEDEA